MIKLSGRYTGMPPIPASVECWMKLDCCAISNFGRVRDLTDNLIPWHFSHVLPEPSRPRVRISAGRRRQVSHVVLAVFAGADEGRFVLHRNDNILDNRFPFNLYYGSLLDNVIDRERNEDLDSIRCVRTRFFPVLIPFRKEL